MYQTSTLIIKFSSREDAKAAFALVSKTIGSINDWNLRLMTYGSNITVGEDCFIAKEDYEGLALKIGKCLAMAGKDFLCYAEHLSDCGEIHDSICCHGKLFRAYTKEENYEQSDVAQRAWVAVVNQGDWQLEEQDCSDSDTQEMQCHSCAEFYDCSTYAPVARCPFCGELEELSSDLEEEVQIEERFGWEEYAFEVPLGVSFPSKRISEGKDWLDDCEINDTFGLDPACFPEKNQYDAALMLCKVCAGWYRFDSDEERMEQITCLRDVVQATKGQPMWYYNVWQRCFDWIAALRENNPRYYGLFSDVDSLWELFSRLQQRSYLEKAECFQWFVDYFGEKLRYDVRSNLPDCYVQNYDRHMEIILFLYPQQIDLLTDGVAAVSCNAARYLAATAAGLIRMGRRKDGIRLYEKVFGMVWEKKSSADDKKAVMDEFLGRLSAGFENEPYLDAEISALLERQCKKYSDTKWTAKISMMLNDRFVK